MVARSRTNDCRNSFDWRPNFHREIRLVQGELSSVGWRVTASELDMPSLTQLYVAGCGRLQLRAPHWATSVALLQEVDHLPHILW